MEMADEIFKNLQLGNPTIWCYRVHYLLSTLPATVLSGQSSLYFLCSA